MIVFPDSESLADYVCKNNVVTWHGCYGMGNLVFIDSSDLHIVFSSRQDYENWCAAGKPVCVQLRLF